MRKIFSDNTPASSKTPFVQFGEHHTKGERPTMEDTSLIQHPETSPHLDFIVAIFDGHNGGRCSAFLKEALIEELDKQMKVHNEGIELAVKETYHVIDQKWINYAQCHSYNDGSTGLAIIVNQQRIIVANTGDCRALMNRAGKCIQLSRDHRPTDPEEMKRIEESGGKVIGGRLQGELALSRAFGDYRFKIDSPLLTCDPEIREFSLTADVEYIVVACDGLYETFENNEVIEFINHQLSNYPSKTMNEIAKALTEEALDRGSHDNITVIIIKFEKKYRKMLSTNTSRSCKKKQNEVLLNIKRKSLDTTLKPKEMRAEKKKETGNKYTTSKF
jgi:serine/threonine protein phosphatase PrpC